MVAQCLFQFGMVGKQPLHQGVGHLFDADHDVQTGVVHAAAGENRMAGL
jgi:hypothetical protein